MKSIKILAMAGAVALLGTAGLTSCNQKNGPEQPEKYLNNKTVKTEFVIKLTDNVSEQSNNTLYMPSATAQIGGRTDFDGIKNIILLPFQGIPEGDNSNRAGKDITLANIAGGVATGHDEGELNAANNIYYSDVTIPLGTKYFLFYGQSGELTPTDAAGKFEHGRLVATGLGTLISGENSGYSSVLHSSPDNIHFDLEPITNNTSFEHAIVLADIATNVAKSSYTDGETHVWGDNSNTEGVKQLHEDFKAIKAGSSQAILATLEDLYNTLERQQSIMVGDPDPMITAIKTEIEKYASVSAAAVPPTYDRTLTWRANYVNSSSQTVIIPSNYPVSQNLPAGAAIIKWSDSSDKFEPVTDGAGVTAGSAMLSTTAINKYVYPASLWYFANSPILTSNSSQKDKYNGSNAWGNTTTGILSNYKDGAQVKTSTRSVAIEKEINYGVGLLEVQLKRIDGTLKDNDGNEFTSSVLNNLFWKGVLVSGQKQVGYDFNQNESASDSYTIYDNYIAGRDNTGLKAVGTSAASNYTLVLGTEDNTTTNHPVKIAVELVNKFGDFVGADGLIPKGGTFYLIAELDVTDATSGVVSGTAPDGNRVFYKDTKTIVNLTIGENSLKKAYYTIPDLRSSNLELGFSVNLNWENGYTFTKTL